MNQFVRMLTILFIFLISLVIVSAAWVGFEHILEGKVHSSDVDGIISIILSGFVTRSIVNLIDTLKYNKSEDKN